MKNKYLIWSNEHRAWWRAHCGYTTDREEAGEYTFGEACMIVKGANKYLDKHATPNEVKVRVK